MKRFIGALVFGWFVVTYSGQPVAGPFTLLHECSEVAKFMASKYYNVSAICQYKN